MFAVDHKPVVRHRHSGQCREQGSGFLVMMTSKKGDKLVRSQGNLTLLHHADVDVNDSSRTWQPLAGSKTCRSRLETSHSVWGKINADLGTTLSKVLTEGLDIQEALNGVAERTRKVMEEAGYYTWNN